MNDHAVHPWRDLRLGVFFILSAVVLIGFLFVVGTNRRIFERSYELRLYISNAQGLSKGSAVRLSGLKVGRVSEMEFVTQDTARALQVNMTLSRRYHEQITKSSVATIRTLGVLGDRFVDISLGNPAEPPLPSESALPVAGEIDWAATFQRAIKMMDDVQVFLQNADKTMSALNRGEGTFGMLLKDEEAADRLRETVANLSAVTHELRSGNGTAGRLLSDPSTFNKLDAILTRLDNLTAAADTGNGALARLLSDEELGARLGSFIAGSDSLVAAVRTGGTTGKLLEDEHLYEDMTLALAELKALLEDIRLNPRRYFKVSVF
jgi:phospholipid/cholesterol/gamma-HCH transport system substrate-binding protein